jgi:hypothetical protein
MFHWGLEDMNEFINFVIAYKCQVYSQGNYPLRIDGFEFGKVLTEVAWDLKGQCIGFDHPISCDQSGCEKREMTV